MAVVTNKNLALHYSTETYGTWTNGKIYTIFPTCWCFNTRTGQVTYFNDLSNSTSVSFMHFQTTPTGTILPIAESTRMLQFQN